MSYAADAVAYDALARSGSPALARITTEWTPRNPLSGIFRLRPFPFSVMVHLRPPAFSRERWDRNEEDVRRLPEYADARAAERRKQCVMLRDIFGNPFRPATIHPSWLTHTVSNARRRHLC